MTEHTIKSRGTRLFIILGGFFVANALIAEFIGVKIFSLEDSLGLQRAEIPLFGGSFSFHLTAGVILWPVVFVMTDLINEYYGPRGVKFLSYLAVALISYAFLMVFFAIRLAPSEYFRLDESIGDSNAAFGSVFGQGLWIIIGSLVAFLVGQVLDVFIFHRIKKATGEKKIWLRATGSTLVSQLIDSFVVLFIAFYLGPRIEGAAGREWSLQQITVTGTGNYLYKFVIAILMTPVIYLIHDLIEKYLGKPLAADMKKHAMTHEAE